MAATLTIGKKKQKFTTKSKLKKTIKNVLCRPDILYWPEVTSDQRDELENVLNKYKVEIPVREKIDWSVLKAIPKADRPKQPKQKKIDGMVFGISDCARLIESNNCAAVILEGCVNPRLIVQHIIEACISTGVPVVCLPELKRIITCNFGFPTSCLGIKKNVSIVEELRNKVIDCSKNFPFPEEVETYVTTIRKKPQDNKEIDDESPFSYLYRTSTDYRVFVPPPRENIQSGVKEFAGQDFIEFSNKTKAAPKKSPYKGMVLKRITNNANRRKT